MKKIYALMMAMMLMVNSVSATTIYCRMAQGWWKADGAAVGAHYWKDGGAGTTWPGVRMTAVNGETDLWSIELDLSQYEKIIFTRVNATGNIEDWGAKTTDLTIPTDGKNLFTITTSTAVWGDPGCDGEWSVYTPGEGPGPGPGPDPQPTGEYDYYIRGFFNGTDTSTPTAEELFEDGVLPFSFTGDNNHKGYFYVMVCEVGQIVGRDYMLKDYVDGGTHVTLYDKENTGNAQKWGIPEGTVTFYLYDNGDGTLELSIEPIPGKTLVGGGSQAIENTKAANKAYKTIINGRLVIIRGEKMFDATGREL